MGTATKTLTYRYNSVGNRSGLTDPVGGRFTYAYDSLNRISHLENPQNERTAYAYDDNCRRTVKKLANGTRASFTYDDANNLTRLANLKSDGTTISSFNYAYDKTGNRTAVLEADGSRVTWSYDDTYQLTGEHRTGSNAYRSTFTYDPAGNRTLKNESGQRTTYAYDAANQLKTAQAALGTTTYTFDADGNQQIVQPPTGPRTTTTWDYENRTTLVELASGLRNTMAYQPDGLRIMLEDSTGTRKFIWDDQNYLAETDETDTTQVIYTNEPAYYGNLVSQRRRSTTNWYHFDALGSTRELTLVSEAASDTYLYDAWGVPIASTGATDNPFRYVGEVGYYFDVDTEASYVRARLYSPAPSRWTTEDPMSWTDGFNLYRYCKNRPSSLVDKQGKISVTLDSSFKRPCHAEFFLQNGFWRVKWSVATLAPVPCDGFLVQHLIRTASYQVCPPLGTGSCVPPRPGQAGDTWGGIDDEWWEAFEVKQGRNTLGIGIDTWQLPPPHFIRRCGEVTITDTFRFFCKSETGDLNTKWGDSCGFWEHCVDEMPKWWDQPELSESTTRTVQYNFNCCKGCVTTPYSRSPWNELIVDGVEQ